MNTAPTRQEADTIYWNADGALHSLYRRLERANEPGQRGMLLQEAHLALGRMATHHDLAFGPDPDGTADGKTRAESLRYEAMLLGLLADVENVVDDLGWVARRRDTGTELEPVAGHILDQMAATPDLAERMRLLEQLYDAVLDTVGGQAAETLFCLPAPGYSGWMTDQQKNQWFERGQAPLRNLRPADPGQEARQVATTFWIVVAVIGALFGVEITVDVVHGHWLSATVGVVCAAISAGPLLWWHRRRLGK